MTQNSFPDCVTAKRIDSTFRAKVRSDLFCRLAGCFTSTWFTVVPAREHCPETFFFLRDTCHVQVPKEVSLHFLQPACATPSPEDTYKKKEIGFIPPVVSSSLSNTKLTLIENNKKESPETKLKLLVTFQSTGQFKSLKCGIREDLMRFKLNGVGTPSAASTPSGII